MTRSRSEFAPRTRSTRSPAFASRACHACRDELRTANGEVPVEVLLIAALVLDATDDVPLEPVVVARRTVQRLGLGTPVEQAVAALVADVNLLSGAARRVDALSEEGVLALAVHLGRTEQARALYLLTRARSSDDQWEQERIDALYDLVQDALAHPELTGRAAANAVEHRKAEAVARTTDGATRERILSAPREYVLTQSPADLVRHAELCEPAPGRSDVRARADRIDDRYRVEIVARDRIGLMAATTRALADAGCDVTSALAVTWSDGTALSSYGVTEPPPDAPALEARLRDLLKAKFEGRPLPNVTLTFDDHGSPWHTRCVVEASDVRGLLHGLTVAFASVGVNVHAASITTDGSRAVDTFELTDKNGAKLDDALKERLSTVVAQGVRPRGRRVAP